jgi:hypothetical protein
MAIYRELFFNNLHGLLSGNFPVICRTLGETPWRDLVRAFYAEHRSHTPLFTEIPREFIRYLQARAAAGREDPPWLAELAHYEWVELALQIADDAVPAHDPQGDLLEGVPVPSPFAWALAYTWPVPHLGPAFQPRQAPAEPTLLLVRRDAAQAIHFAQLSPLVFRLWELLAAGQASGRAALQVLAGEAGVAADAAFLREGSAMLARMHAEGSLLGTRPL